MGDTSLTQDQLDFIDPPFQVQENYRKAFGKTVQIIETEVAEIKTWLNTHPILPAVEDDKFLERFHAHCKFNVDKTKRKLEIYYKTRTTESEILLNRNPRDPLIAKYQEGLEVICLPLPTPDGYRVSIIRLKNRDVDYFEPEVSLKLGLMMLDSHIRIDGCLNHVLVFDAEGYEQRHIVKLTPSLFSKLDKCAMKAFPFRYVNIHILNALPFLYATINVFKMFLGRKMASRLIPHTDYKSFYNYVPKDILPIEYGGTTNLTLDQLRDFAKRKLIEKQDWFEKERNIFADLKNFPENSSETFGSKGTFKKIEVD